jgi:hypothetical protein
MLMAGRKRPQGTLKSEQLRVIIMTLRTGKQGQRIVVVAAALATMLIVNTASAQTADEVIAKNLKAQGGREALLGLKAVERKGKVSVDGTFGQMAGTIEDVSIPWKKARRAIDLEVFAQKDGFNGETAWRDGMAGVQDLEGEESMQIKQAVDLNPFVMAEKRGAKIEKLDDEKVNDVDYYVLQLTPKDRPPVKFYVDKKTDLIGRMTLTQNHPQFGEMNVTIESSDYAPFGGIKLANHTKATLGEVMQIETTYTETKVNGEVDEAIFEKPKDAGN